jgi:lipopolysaccharide/colanic/teichoic acid biosynthesis glycosyltransferase
MIEPTSSATVTGNHPSLGFPKRFLDVVLAGSGLILLSPVFLLVALAVKFTTPGPILFRRAVYGREGRQFVMLKFRSMVDNAHEMLLRDANLLQNYTETLKIEDDVRITRLGRFLRRSSLDELPQLVNVLAGDMSLVGPRVLGDIELKRYGHLRHKILSVQPGLTGLWQVSGRQDTSFEERMALDEQYIDAWSLRQDLVILARTVFAVIGMKGAH